MIVDNNFIIPDFDDEKDTNLKVVLSVTPDLPNILQVYLNGSIDNYNTIFFEHKMEKILDHGDYKILFKCASLDYVSSSAIGVFANFYPKFKALGGTFVFIDLSPKVVEVFQLLGFSHFFNIVADEDEANMFFNNSSKPVEMIFPRIIECPMCNSKLKTQKAGIFKCSRCKTILKVSDSGQVSIN